MENCLFCKIAAGTVPAQRLYEDELVVAIRDINPQAPVHLLILPKRHLASVLDLGEAEGPLLSRITQVAIQLAKREGVAARGFRLLINTGRDGGQNVPHLHFHLLGGRPMGWPPG
jgi:histidine triad (HIT) family protein